MGHLCVLSGELLRVSIGSNSVLPAREVNMVILAGCAQTEIAHLQRSLEKNKNSMFAGYRAWWKVATDEYRILEM